MSPPSIRRALVGACAPFMRLPFGTRLALAALAACCTLRGGGKGAGARAPRAAGGPRSRAAAAVAEADVARGWRVVSEAPSGSLDEPPGAVTNRPLRLRGGSAWAFRVAPPGWRFPWAGGTLAGVTVLARGEARPDARTRFFPVPLRGGLSLLPEARWGLLPDGGASVFRHAVTEDGTLLLDWRNALRERDPDRPTDLRLALHADGSFAWYADGRVTRYAPVLPFDWDGDGLANAVDPEPLVPDPADAHGANAEWYRVVCSNVFEAAGDRTQQVVSLPNGEAVAFRAGANARAYHFVDVVAAAGPAPVSFAADRASRLGSPVLVARAGETNRVPLLVGIAYAVTSTVPVAVSAAAPGGFAEIEADGPCAYAVRWPLGFEAAREGRATTFRAVPYDPGGTFEWTSGAGARGGARRAARSGGCPFTAGGGTVAFDCSGGCGCGGCSVAGTYRLEGALFQLPPATCGCREGDDDDDNPLGPDPPPDVPAAGGVSVSFSAKAVVFEDRHETAPGAWAERRSTRTVLAVRADGGPDGGTFTLTPRNIGKLAPEGGTGPLALPSGWTLAPGETYSATFECSGVEASGAEGDVAVSASFTDAGSGETQGDEAKLTVVEVALRAAKTAPENPCPNRHVYGIDETVLCLQRPSSPQVVWASSGGGIVSDSLPVAYRCPIRAERDGLTASVGSVSYCPKIEVKEPERLACTAVGYLPANPLTGIGMALEVCVFPRTVSFEGLLLQEVAAPANATSPEWGVHSGFFADLAYQTRWYHYATWGAGQWIEVSQGNLFGRYDESRMMRWPRPWSNGNMTWAIPIAWKSGYPPYADEEGRLGVVYQSEWTMADDALTKTKHGQVLVLTESGQVFLNGEHNGTE